jgi:hypothetical protein
MTPTDAPHGALIEARIGLHIGYLYRPKGRDPLIEPLPAGGLKAIPDVVRQRGEARITDCSTFAGVGVVGALPGQWDDDSYGDMQITDAARPYSPIEAAIRSGVGREVGAPVADRWHLVQVWRVVDDARPVIAEGGHAFLWFGGEVGTKVHASSGVGRVLAEDATWADQCKRYQGRRLAVLG